MKIAKGKEDRYKQWVEANSNNYYNRGVINFAKRWAEILEKQIDEQNTEDPKTVIFNNADWSSHDADTEGITGFQYGCAVSFLADVWEYGKLLNSWNNIQYGYSEDTEGTVNPAVWAIKQG